MGNRRGRAGLYPLNIGLCRPMRHVSLVAEDMPDVLHSVGELIEIAAYLGHLP